MNKKAKKFSFRNRMVTDIVKKHLKDTGVRYVRMYREERTNKNHKSNIDGHRIKFYGVRDMRVAALWDLNEKLAPYDVEVWLHIHPGYSQAASLHIAKKEN